MTTPDTSLSHGRLRKPILETTTASTSCDHLHEIPKVVAEVACEYSRLSFSLRRQGLFAGEKTKEKMKRKEKAKRPLQRGKTGVFLSCKGGRLQEYHCGPS